MHETPDERAETFAIPPTKIPPVLRATPDELARRREVVQRMLERRERVGPIGIRADDLLHASRFETDH